MIIRCIGAFSMAVLLAGCSQAYSTLERDFAVDALEAEPSVRSTSMTIGGPSHVGATNYGGVVDLYVSGEGIGVSVSLPFHQPIHMPTERVSGCAMTCFGTNDRHVELLIESTGSVVSFPEVPQLLDWCWEARKPVFPGEAERVWKYNGGRLPSMDHADPQFASREAYGSALMNNCRGF
ncbi:hypothetical protein [Aquimonas voraii]|uniref:Lipoprotein n=1 Tax=Aquimonas voraii TaxID=265719 RepID=A0A1G6ZAV8_9GAMM|nr:hypothetical protein [Aquimonas voraii]SDD99157.1 hypothetical protein SAMN04488509_1133 [Aquimonas voraii]